MQTTNHAMYVAAVSSASPERNDAEAGAATADSTDGRAARVTLLRALLNLNRTIAAPLMAQHWQRRLLC